MGGDGPLLPSRKPTPNRHLDVERSRTDSRQLMHQHDTERFHIGSVIGFRAFDQRRELQRCVPQRRIFEMQPRDKKPVKVVS